LTTLHLNASPFADVDPASEWNGASAQSSSRALPASLARLPADLQAALMQISSVGRGLFGHRDTQSIFGDNLEILEGLYKIGASHFDVSQLLHDVGITRADGELLSVGTVSSAMSRARRAAAHERGRPGNRGRSSSGPRASVPPGAAQSGAAIPGRAQPRSAASDVARPPHAPADPEGPAAPSRGSIDLRGGTSDRSDGDNPASQPVAPHFEAAAHLALARASPGDADNSTRARAAARLLNQLRNDDDDEI
jgi:hypothetical protein